MVGRPGAPGMSDAPSGVPRDVLTGVAGNDTFGFSYEHGDDVIQTSSGSSIKVGRRLSVSVTNLEQIRQRRPRSGRKAAALRGCC